MADRLLTVGYSVEQLQPKWTKIGQFRPIWVIWGVLDRFWTPRRLSNLCRELQNDEKQLFWVYFGGFGCILASGEGFCNN